jgi:hypothetical protein
MPTFSDGEPFAHGDNFRKWLAPFIGQPAIGVEVGSWEGRSALWLMENVLTHPLAYLHCVDTWEGEEAQKSEGHDFALKERNFLANTEAYRDAGRLIVWKDKSENVLPILPHFRPAFIEFAYIDGSHQAPDVLMDALLVWRILKPGGVIIFDDYEWLAPGYPETHKPRLAINAFLAVFQERLEVLDKGYQVAIRKTV